MIPSNPQRYLETQVMTASRERLLLMLYDGALRFSEQARQAIASKDLERSHQSLIQAQRIVIELWGALSPQADAELAKNLGNLYGFVYLRLVHANVQKDPVALEEAVRILTTLRQAWAEAAEKIRLGQEPSSSLQVQDRPVTASPRDLPFEVSLYEAVVASDPTNVEALMALGEAHTRTGDYARGLDVDQRLSRLRPEDPVVHYNLACSLSLLGRREAALSTLERAVALGYSDLAHLDKDPDLEALRQDPRFGELRRRLTKVL